MPLDRQLSLFGVEARPASPLDFEGLLAGAGQVVRMGGTARVSVVVDAAWRARALLAEAHARGLAATCERTEAGERTEEEGRTEADERTGADERTENEVRIRFRTAYSSALAVLGVTWLRGGVKRPPPGLALDGRRLRLWAVAAGGRDGAAAFTLGLGAADEQSWEAVGAALAAVGLPATLLEPPAEGGPAYRITGRRRLARLAELVGDPPSGVPAEIWV